MVEAREATNTADWRHGESYRYTSGLPRRGWAWEFLRRNPDYRRDAAALSTAVSMEARDAGLTVLTAGAARRALARWGVLFRRFS
jgi:hypothetical protein